MITHTPSFCFDVLVTPIFDRSNKYSAFNSTGIFPFSVSLYRPPFNIMKQKKPP